MVDFCDDTHEAGYEMFLRGCGKGHPIEAPWTMLKGLKRENSVKQTLSMISLSFFVIFAAQTGLAQDLDNNPPGPVGGPGTNWENPPGPEGGPGASPDRRFYPYRANPPGPVGGPGAGWYYKRPYRNYRYDNPPGPRGGAGTNWENPPGPRGGPGASPNRRYRW
jgi:hypothetical protein